MHSHQAGLPDNLNVCGLRCFTVLGFRVDSRSQIHLKRLGRINKRRFTLRILDESSAPSPRVSTEQRGPDGKIVDLLSELRSDCPKHLAGDMGAARCPELLRVM